MYQLSLAVFLAFGALTLMAAVYRKMIARNEDDYVHVGSAAQSLIPQQQATAQKLEMIDRAGKILTILTVIFGLVWFGFFVYAGWLDSMKPVR